MSYFELGNDGPLVILVGVDGSDSSMHAAAYAAGMARRHGAELVIVYVGSTPQMSALVPSLAGSVEETLEEVAQDLRKQIEEAASREHTLNYRFLSVHGDPYTELTRIADETRADAVVVGASEQAGHRLVGSIAVRLVRSGRWPVTVVP
ncbi:universal stress protein [Fodinicola feengrottensis]|uniref:Universal stress protein n=1 Tax=Fodinicola feengrottensis TaxID=435914 RepID=A0ABN2ISA9_9ACTN|nr:universal stress protein [Fodinicola feengrottensis]